MILRLYHVILSEKYNEEDKYELYNAQRRLHKKRWKDGSD